MKLSPYQERLSKLRAEQRMKDEEIARLLGKKPQTIRVEFMRIREELGIPSFEEAWKKYKKEHGE
jgi:IS30 family transposase